MPRSSRPKVIIIGAGAAGLAAARVLASHRVPFLILEARPRIGGRICTIADPKFPLPVELGAEFIHGRPESTWNHVRAANLLTYDIPFEHRRRHAGLLAEMHDYAGELGKIMNGLSRLRKDMTFAQYLREHRSDLSLAQARALALDFVQGFDAADPERISAKSLAREQEGLGDLDDEKQFRLLAGYKSLIDHLSRGIHNSIRLSTVVRQIDWGPHRVTVHTDKDTFVAPAVLITLPLGVFQLPAESPGAVRFVPALPDKVKAAGHLASGPIVKAVVAFKSSFWEESSTRRSTRGGESLADASFLHDPQSPFPTWWTQRPLRASMLTGWAGGSKAIALTTLSRKALKSAAIKSLATIFSRRQAVIAGLITNIHIYDWSNDPYARGAYSYELIGGSAARRNLAKPISKTLFFAGEATDTQGQASTVAGAIASGERAAHQILRLR